MCKLKKATLGCFHKQSILIVLVSVFVDVSLKQILNRSKNGMETKFLSKLELS